MMLKTKNNLNVRNFVTVIFSYDRPMQLDLTLNTYEKYSLNRNIEHEFVIYKTSDNRYENAYKQVAKEHPNIKFIKETTFKINLYQCIKGKEYVMFLVDDCIFTRIYSIKEVLDFVYMCQGALGFSLRLGMNTKYCYPLNVENNLPFMQPLGTNLLAFNWRDAGQGDFSYPLEVSSSVYRIDDIKPIIEGIHYSNPNQLEWVMYNYIPNLVNRPFLLCHESSVAFCAPINRVQTENNNRVGINPYYSVENLLDLYEKGYRINTLPLGGFISNGCHQEIEFDFLEPTENKYDNREYR
jgi:hypothetical protein